MTDANEPMTDRLEVLDIEQFKHLLVPITYDMPFRRYCRKIREFEIRDHGEEYVRLLVGEVLKLREELAKRDAEVAKKTLSGVGGKYTLVKLPDGTHWAVYWTPYDGTSTIIATKE